MAYNHFELEAKKLELQAETRQKMSEEFLRRLRESNDEEIKVLKRVGEWVNDTEIVTDDEQ